MTENIPDKVPTDRERDILKLVVEDYIQTASPVPSKRLKDRFNIALSPASIRNTLHALEETGFLNHLHTSSGRVPTDYGYRFYVDELIDLISGPENIKSRMMEELSIVALNVDEILQVTANALAQISNLFGFAYLSSNRNAKLTDLDLVSLSSGHVLLILGFQSDQIKTVVLNVAVEVRDSLMETVSSVLRERLLGLTIKEIRQTIAERLKDQDIFSNEIVQVIIDNVEVYFSTSTTNTVCTSQKDYLLQNPEFSEPREMQSIVTALDNESLLVQSMPVTDTTGEAEVVIGSENRSAAFRDCSVVAGTFEHGELMGRLGIIGPTRMSYKDAQLLVNTFISIVMDVYDG
ncbi:MAG: heat-inducible transcriptional repressor HrcA [Candidatus Marinimicrobia bacterium]|jgi:heat-inducible transcriptional repressor|nr:heat-inducible transcriptional repressor HrcA [Candidatus Neomarinimicrobiota bacterium]MDP6594159.1 heat-inducible transcriptional repressor HrcA [Candidatus Neomarinimicrobiota bacterium]MDP6835637.1 heat-inducible transcriptional repressor HrcA [Candidatus Neomarinimicrobiota bacterium]MDP6966872.1 heat-inducible transcriptional repressor HrcA [Candidatus Neomarinimicrobiota bacterium]|tara:strand:+ start:7183 stop:8226 length:1044 start_codon:yes stop_codon:yes gene_type:complete